MNRLTYWNPETNRYEIDIDGVKHHGSITDRLAEYEELEKEGLIFDVTKQMDLESAKRIISTLLEGQIGVPIPKESVDYMVDDFLK